VQVCALGECSITDDKGQWGFSVDQSFPGGDVAFTIKGHGIDSAAVANIPATARDVFIELVREGEVIEVMSTRVQQ